MTSPLKIAVLINGFESPYSAAVRASFETSIASGSALSSESLPPTVDFYDPIVAQIHPDPTKYDLIVLSGGTVDPRGSDAWVVKLQNYLRSTVEAFPKQKFVGICWGHQTTSITFGGSVRNMETAEIGATEITLTAEGRKMFPFAVDGHIHLHEFHAREIGAPGKGFIALAEGNQSFLNEANTIITFQGHPELNTDLARTFVQNAPAYMGIDSERKESLIAKVGLRHDGVKIWARILE